MSAALLARVDYQATSLGNNQMGKESEYTFAKLSAAENYKRMGKGNDFCLERLGTLGIR